MTLAPAGGIYLFSKVLTTDDDELFNSFLNKSKQLDANFFQIINKSKENGESNQEIINFLKEELKLVFAKILIPDL